MGTLTARIIQQVDKYREIFPAHASGDLLAIVDHVEDRIYVGPRVALLAQAPSLINAFDLLAQPATEVKPNVIDAVWVCHFDADDWASCCRLRLEVGNAPGGEA